MNLKQLSKLKFSTLFLEYHCEQTALNVFKTPSRYEIIEAMEPLQIPEDNCIILPAIQLPAYDCEELIINAVVKTDYNLSDREFHTKLMSNILLESLKNPSTRLCSPLIFTRGKKDSDKYLYKMGEGSLSRYISKKHLQNIQKILHISLLTEMFLVPDRKQLLHLKK